MDRYANQQPALASKNIERLALYAVQKQEGQSRHVWSSRRASNVGGRGKPTPHTPRRVARTLGSKALGNGGGE